MKNTSLGLALAVISFQAFSQTTYYTNPNGMPAGQAQQVGNTTYYTSPNGMPAGQAQTLSVPTQPMAPLTPQAPVFPPTMFNQK